MRVSTEKEEKRAWNTWSGKFIDRVRSNKGKVVLDPMFAFERRVVHEIAKSYRDIKSYSIGIEPYRKVVIEYCDSKDLLKSDQDFKSSVRGS